MPAGDSPVINDGSVSSSEDEDEDQGHELNSAEKRRARENDERKKTVIREEDIDSGQHTGDENAHNGDPHKETED